MIKIFKTPKDIPFNDTDVFLHFTGNIFGIGCSAFNDEAINKILKLKQRNEKKGFIVLFSSIEQARKYSIPLLKNRKVVSLLNQYLPGNLTALLEIENRQFDAVSVNRKIAFRIPRTKVLRDFINRIGTPILSTSINIAGQPYCTDLNTLHEQYSHWFDYGLYNAAEPADEPKPSTILDFDEYGKQVKCLREGSIPFAEIQEAYDRPLIQFVCIGNICRSPLAEYYVRKKIDELGLPFTTASCGLFDESRVISEHSKFILDTNKIPIGKRMSITIDGIIVRKSLILICMSKDIKKYVITKFPEAAEKTYTFAEFTNNKQDIDDPYGLEFEQFEKVWRQIKQYTEPLIETLQGLV